MSIRLEVLSQEIIERLNALERKVESITIPINPKITVSTTDKLVPKHLMFGKWGLAHAETGQIIDEGPYTKAAAHKAAKLDS